MNRIATALSRGLAVVLPIAAGGLAIMFSGVLAKAPENKEKTSPPTPVRVLTLEPVNVVPRVMGYGTVAPAREWRALARVDGEVAETSPMLANGQIAPKGTVLLRIDDTDLKLAIAQTDAQLRALDIKDETLRLSLAINQADLRLSEADLERQKELLKQGVGTQTKLEQAERAALAARAKVTETENQLKLNAAERDVLATQLAVAERNLDFLTITAPYDLRIGAVSAEIGQVVTRGATLLTAEGTDAAEVTAQFPIGRMGPVVRSLGEGGAVTDLTAVVRMPVPGHVAEWPARVERIGETVDARTQSANIIVRVDDPLDLAKPGVRPPLRRNMFVEVKLAAAARPALAVPAEALQGGQALVIGEGDRLEQRSVETAYVIDGIAIVAEGLKAGDRLVVTDPAIAMPGMVVKPTEDEALKARIASVAKGEGTGE